MARRKLGRNERCWCGSGKKYKHCHLGREIQAPLSPWDASRELRNAFGARTCLAPEAWRDECSQQISRAHTVPKSGSLRQIARDGHVYAFVPSLENLMKNNGVVAPELIGLNRASTFTGFCSRHDDAIFRPVEKRMFSCSQEQCFLLAYRALAREIYTKKAAASLTDIRRDADKGRSLDDQHQIQTLNFLYDAGLRAGLRDNDHYKSIYATVLLENDFSCVRSYVIEFGQPPDVMCSGGVFPEQDFEGGELQDIADLAATPHLLTFTSFYGGDCGAVVFTWLPESDRTCKRFIESLHLVPDATLTNALLRFFFEHCENVHMNPDWWEKLPAPTRDAVIERMAASANPEMARPGAILTDDGVNFSPWKVIRRQSVGFEI